MIDIRTANGIPMRVRFVKTGERYGLRDCLVHDDPRPMVEFYDARFATPGDGAGRGQFISRYFAETLIDDETRRGTGGLILDGGNRGWDVDARTMAGVMRFVRACLARESTRAPVLEDSASLTVGCTEMPMTLRVYGRHHRAHPGQSGGKGERRLSPPEPAGFEIESVTIGAKGHELEIMHILDERTLDAINELLLETA